MESSRTAGKHPRVCDSNAEEDISEEEMNAGEEEECENAPLPLVRQREAEIARMEKFFGFGSDSPPTQPLVQDDSNFSRKMYWSCIQDGGFPHRVNHAVASHM